MVRGKALIKVGDKVLIVADATQGYKHPIISVVHYYNVQSAIGCIGEIVEIFCRDTLFEIGGLPPECYRGLYSWLYERKQFKHHG